jgi:hypothetical protein
MFVSLHCPLGHCHRRSFSFRNPCRSPGPRTRQQQQAAAPAATHMEGSVTNCLICTGVSLLVGRGPCLFRCCLWHTYPASELMGWQISSPRALVGFHCRKSWVLLEGSTALWQSWVLLTRPDDRPTTMTRRGSNTRLPRLPPKTQAKRQARPGGAPKQAAEAMPSSRGDARAGRALAQGLDFRTPCISVPPGWNVIAPSCCFSQLLSIMSDDATYLLRYVYRRQPAADEISEIVVRNVRTIANTAADKPDDILKNKPRYYSEDGRRRAGYVGASISKRSVQGAVNRADTSAPGLGALARLVMDKFEGTAFVKLFMYTAYEGLFPFHSDVLPANGERKIRVSISLSDMMPPFTVCAGRVRVRSLRCTVSARKRTKSKSKTKVRFRGRGLYQLPKSGFRAQKSKSNSELDFEVQVQVQVQSELGLEVQVQVQVQSRVGPRSPSPSPSPIPSWASKYKSKSKSNPTWTSKSTSPTQSPTRRGTAKTKVRCGKGRCFNG